MVPCYSQSSKLYLDSGNEKIGIRQVRARVDGFKCSSQEITKLPIVDAKLEGLSLSGKFEGRLPSVHLEAAPSEQDSFALFAAMGIKRIQDHIYRNSPLLWKTNAEGNSDHFSPTSRPDLGDHQRMGKKTNPSHSKPNYGNAWTPTASRW